ncbi:helix-turn-helix transcriptional regulator [Aeromonas bestiarum]|uniref:helix-turn-helix transcriptional regulator n=1 Tax=Aeromonas bestiarum TaxID=105751 RepID=UPI0025B1587D|nr:AlpA family phage regulatory protein [Aeromonas bestiarum]
MAHKPERHTLPTAGFIRQSVLLPYLGFSASTLWRKVKQSTFPAPVKLSERVTAWSAALVSAWVLSKNTVK